MTEGQRNNNKLLPFIRDLRRSLESYENIQLPKSFTSVQYDTRDRLTSTAHHCSEVKGLIDLQLQRHTIISAK